MAGYADDEPTAEELAALSAAENNATLPPAEDEGGQPLAPPAAAEPGKAPAAAPGEGGPAAAPAPADGAAAAGLTDDQRFAAFYEQHKGKSPEELARLAYQQSQRAAREGFQARQARESVETIQARLADFAARRQGIATERTAFADQLRDDPDAAARAMHERMMTAEETRIQQEEQSARRDAAVGMAMQAIPAFNMDSAREFGAEMNYTPQEMDGVTDVRDLATLHFASLTGRLVKAGVMDLQGNILNMPAPVAATDPRLAAPAPLATLSSAPARGTAGGQTLEQQLADIAGMTDAQMQQMEKDHPGLIESLLRKAG